MSTRDIIVLFVFTLSLNTLGLAQKAPATFLLHGEALLKNKQAINNQEAEKIKGVKEYPGESRSNSKARKLYSVMNKKGAAKWR